MAGAGTREPLLSWRRISFVLIGLLVLVFLYNAVVPHSSSRSNTPNAHLSPPQSHDTSSLFTFGNATTDNEAFDGLTPTQCASAFPNLYSEVDRAVTYWKQAKHTISPTDTTISPTQAAMRILIHENELRVLESYHSVDPLGASPDRALGVLYLLQRALDSATAAGERLPTIEAALNFQDDAAPPGTQGDSHTFWTFARTLSEEAHQRLWLMPNFDFWYYKPTGSFADAKRAAKQHDAPFASKTPQIVWRGNPGFNADLRGGLLAATEGKDWADVKPVYFNEDPPVAIDVDQFCRYAMTVYTEGVTYSGRLKFLMNCRSLLFVHDTLYVTHYSHLLVADGPEQNFVPVKRDWSDLEEKVKYYLGRPEEAEKIIVNSLAVFRSRYTTRAATSCYIRKLIQGYGEVAWHPEVDVPGKNGPKRRGVPFEKFIVEPADRNFESQG